MTFSDNPKRDAHRTFAGYVYQVDASVLHWLRLGSDEHLELESGEDIDLVRHSVASSDEEQERVLQQLKDLGHSLTLRSPDAREALANFCHHKQTHPNIKLAFRFLTTATVGKEQEPWADEKPGISLWEDLRTDQIPLEERPQNLEQLRTFLKELVKPGDLSEEVWASLQQVLHGDLSAFEDIVDHFEWATGSGDHEAIEQIVIRQLQTRDSERSEIRAKGTYRNLFSYVIKLLTQKGLKKLTLASLEAELAETSVTIEELVAADRLRSWIERVDNTLAEHEERLTFLETAAAGARDSEFYTPEADASDSSLLFDYSQTLRGRSGWLKDLNAFLKDDTKRIAILSGRGGVGKSKLLRDWSSQLGAWTPLWINPYGTWTAESGAAVPETDVVLIADDAHRYSQIEEVIAYSSGNHVKSKFKLIIATRPSGRSYVDNAIAVASDESMVTRYKTLEAPGGEAILEIAKEVLGSQFEYLAGDLARVSGDTPLVTVVGGRLIARRQIPPELLNNDHDFRHQVLDKFASECEGNLPVGGRSRRELLHLIAAVQPVTDQNVAFAERGAAFMNLRSDQIRKGLDDLENQGILLRSKTGARIAPDLLGDFLLEDASLDNGGTPTGFADAVFDSFEASHLANILKNFAELDWRITQSNPDSQLLNSVWSKIYERFHSQHAELRSEFLQEVKRVAVFQPEKVEALVQIAMDEPAEPGREWAVFRLRTQDDVLVNVPALLGDTIYHEATSRDAFRRLWTLAHHVSNEVHRRARKELEDAIGYNKYKNPIYNERILSMVEEIASDEQTYRSDFSPLTLMDKLMEREVDDTSRRGRAVSISYLPVNYAAIDQIRNRALRVIESALFSDVPRIAVRAASSIASIVSEFHPRFRALPTADEQLWQDHERLAVLDVIDGRIKAGNLPLALTWKLGRLLNHIGRRDAQTHTVKDRAAELKESLPRPRFIDYLDILLTNPYEDAYINGNEGIIPQSRFDHENSALSELVDAFPDAEERVRIVEGIARQAYDAGIDLMSLGEIVQRQCQDRSFLRALTEFALQNDRSVLAMVSHVALAAWRDADPTEFERYGLLYANSSNFIFVVTAAEAVSKGPALNSPVDKDVVLLTALAQRAEGRVLGPVLFGLKRLVQVPRYSKQALSLYANLKVGNDELLAKEYCEFFGNYGLPAHYLDTATVERMLENLVEVDELDRDAFGGLLSRIFKVAPLAFLRLFEQRILRRIERGSLDEHSEYEPIPSSFSWSGLAGQTDDETYRAAVKGFIGLMQKFPRFEHSLSDIFWHVSSLDLITMGVLDELLHLPNDEGPNMVLRLLSGGAKGVVFSNPMFGMHILSECSDRSSELGKRAQQTLTSNSLRIGNGIQVYAGSIPPDPDNSHTASAELMAAAWQPGSLPNEFYSNLAGVRVLPIPPPDFDTIFGDEPDDDESNDEEAGGVEELS